MVGNTDYFEERPHDPQAICNVQISAYDSVATPIILLSFRCLILTLMFLTHAVAVTNTPARVHLLYLLLSLLHINI